MPEDRGDPHNSIATARSAGQTTLTEPAAKSLLSDAGVAVPESAVAASPDEAVTAAESVGYPVVLKVCSPGITHKSDWGDGAGVALGLESEAAVRRAAERVFDAVADAEPDGDGVEVLVEAAHDVDRGTEVIVGGLRDRSFGPVVLCGLGGVFAEVYEDTSHRLAPVDRATARRAVRELTAAPLLEGYRGREPADLDALADVVVAVGDLVVATDAIAEIDVNPVLATADGAVALDAHVVLAGD